MKKYIEPAEVVLIRLDANDTICTSQLGVFDEDENNPNNFQIPSRFNYRGMVTDWEADYDF